MKRAMCLVTLLVIAPAAAMAAEHATVPDGSFENGMAGWTSKGAAVREMPGVAPHGKHAVELDPAAEGGGQLTCKVKLTVGVMYRISFRVNSPAFKNSFLCTYLNSKKEGEDPYHIVASHIGGHSYAKPSSEAPAPKGKWIKRSAIFVAEREDNVLRIGPAQRWSGGKPGKLWIDDVRIVPTGGKVKYGKDWEYRAILPSEAAVGKPVRLTLSAVWISPGISSRYGTPTRFAYDVKIACTDAKSTVPKQVDLRGEDWAIKHIDVTFNTPGVHRLTVTDKDGNKTISNPIRVTEKLPKLRHYWGDLHIHTRYQHGGEKAGDENDNYKFCRDVAALDFAALSEHYASSVTPKVWLKNMAGATKRFHQPGKFVTLFGMESGSWQGHHNWYLRSGNPLDMHDRRDRHGSTENVMDYFRSRKTAVMVLPHHFALLQPTDWRMADRDYYRLVEVYSNHGSSEEPGKWWRLPSYTGSGNSYRESGAVKGCTWRDALARGRRLGAIGAGDAHSGRPGLTGVACALAEKLDREPVFDAMYARRCYATTNKRIVMDYSINDALMGQELFLKTGAAVKLAVRANACDKIKRIDIVSDGKVIDTIDGGGTMDLTIERELAEYDGKSHYYYLRLLQMDGHRAWTSPIWLSPAGMPDLCVERKDVTFDHAKRALHIELRNYGDDVAETLVRIYSSAKGPLIGRRDFAGRKTGVAVRVEPINDSEVLLKILIWSNMRRGSRGGDAGEYKCSGKVTFENARSVDVAVDPRNVLKKDADNNLSWSDTYGMFFKGSQSRSAPVSDMAIRVGTAKDTTVSVAVEIDGKPSRLLALGSLPGPADTVVRIPLGGLARKTLLARSAPMKVWPHGRGPGMGWVLATDDVIPGVTYVVVLDPDNKIAEVDERNNVYSLEVPTKTGKYPPWPSHRN